MVLIEYNGVVEPIFIVSKDAVKVNNEYQIATSCLKLRIHLKKRKDVEENE